MTKRLNATMRGFLLGLFAGLAMQTSAQVDDGIYVIPSFDAYLVILSRNDIVNAYYFGLDGEDSYWLAMQGSRVGETIELVDQVNGELGASRLEQDGLGLKMSLIYCNKYPLDVENPCGDSVEEAATRLDGLFIPLLNAHRHLLDHRNPRGEKCAATVPGTRPASDTIRFRSRKCKRRRRSLEVAISDL